MDSKKKVAKKKAGSKALVSYKDRLAKYAEQEETREKESAGAMISIKGKKFRFHGNEIGKELPVVILNYSFTRSYYDRDYDEENLAAPACFAVQLEHGEDMDPSADAPNKQNDSCGDCWANEYKSDKRGKGKACREFRLLATVHEDDLATLLEGGAIDEVQVAYLKVPPTSLGSYKAYVKKLAKGLKRPPFGVITEITFDDLFDHPKLNFECTQELPEELFDPIVELRESAADVLVAEPDFSTYEPLDGGKKKKSSKKKAATKKATTKKAASKKKKTSKFSR